MLKLRTLRILVFLAWGLTLPAVLAPPTCAQDQTDKDQTVDGVKVPKGVTKDFVKGGKKFAEDMIANYKLYLQLTEAVKQKKQKGEALTDVEKEIDKIKTYDQMEEWVKKQKEKKGYKVTTAGTTDAFGNVEKKTPKPKTPDDEFEDELTLKVHEPSHVEGNKKRATLAGLTWEEVERIGKIQEKVRKGGTPTDEELDFFGKVKEKFKKYLELCSDPVEGAKEEIQEYEAENKIREKVLSDLLPLPGPGDFPLPKRPGDSEFAFVGKNQIFLVGTVSADDEVLITVRGPKPEELKQIRFEGVVEETGKTVRVSANEQGRSIVSIPALAAGITIPAMAIIRARDSSGNVVASTTAQIMPGLASPVTSPPQIARWPPILRPGNVFTVEGKSLGTGTQIFFGGLPQEVLSASSDQAIGYLNRNAPTGPADLVVKNHWGESASLPTIAYDFGFQAPKRNIVKGETLPIVFRYKDFPAGTRVDITNETRQIITLRSETSGTRQRDATITAELTGSGEINLLARGVVAGEFVVSAALDLPALASQTFSFTNNTGKDVNDLHIEFSDAVTVSDADVFKDKPKGASNTINLKGGTVKDGDSATITTDTKAKNPVWIRAWYWTNNGDFTGCVTLTFENPNAAADTFKLKFSQPVNINSFEPAQNGQNQPTESSLNASNEFTLSKLKGLPKGSKVTITVCHPPETKGQKSPPKFGQPTWK